MSKWPMVKLGDVCEGKSSNIAQKDLEFNNGLFPIYGAAGFIKNVDFYKHDREYIGIVKDGAGVGRATIHPARSSVIGTMQALLPNSQIIPKYLYYVISNMDLARYYTGATIPHIYFKDYSKELLSLPPLLIQQKIADILDRTSALIEKRKSQIAKLDLLVKSQFIEMFGSTLGKDTVELKDVCSIITDGTHQSPKFIDSGIPFLLVSNIVDNQLTYETKKFISREEFETLIKRTPVEIGDLLLTIVGSYGNPAVVKTEQDFCFQRHIAYMKPNRETINSIYLHAAFLNGAVKEQIAVKVKGIAQKTLNLFELKTIKINLPTLSLQNRFADFVRQADKSKFELQQGLVKLELLYKSLMQKCFNGELFK